MKCISCIRFWLVSWMVLTSTEMWAQVQQPVELGQVRFQRDLAAARRQSAINGKPIFVLFQEVPGCETCQTFGRQPLSHPLLVEAIEDRFEPILIYNNKPSDEALLKQFVEPSWNNPVVRYLSADGADLLPRKDRIWTTGGTVERMIAALEAANQKVPNYLQIVAESRPPQIEVAEFAMHCYWEGEGKLGSIDGVLSTRSGWRGKLEVVQVTYNPRKVNYKKLLSTAQSFDCASKVFAHSDAQLKAARQSVGQAAVPVSDAMRDAKSSDQKYYLRQSPYHWLPLTELQATKINAALFHRQKPDSILSPRQSAMLKQVVTLLRSDPEAFKGWQATTDEEQLPTYAEKLRQKLATSDASSDSNGGE